MAESERIRLSANNAGSGYLGYNRSDLIDTASSEGGEMLDLGISGRKAIVCAASKGLGRACAMALGRAGVELVITARTKETLDQTAAEIRKETGAKVTPIAGDISTEAGRRTAISGNGRSKTGRRRSTPTC